MKDQWQVTTSNNHLYGQHAQFAHAISGEASYPHLGKASFCAKIPERTVALGGSKHS